MFTVRQKGLLAQYQRNYIHAAVHFVCGAAAWHCRDWNDGTADVYAYSEASQYAAGLFGRIWEL